MLKKTFLTSWYFFVFTLLLTAFLLSVARGYPTLYQNYLETIQSEISTIIERPVKVEKLLVTWHGITPLITVKDISIYKDDSYESKLLFVRKAYLSINLYKSILNREVIFNNLSLLGGNLELHRTINNDLIFNGINLIERFKNKKGSYDESVKVSLLDSSVAIKDDIKKINYFFDQVDLEFRSGKGHVKITSKISLPETLGEKLVLVADLRNVDKEFDDIKGDLYAKGKSINLQLISDLYPKLQLGLFSGYSDFDIWGNLKSFSNKTFSGNFRLYDLKYKNQNSPINGATYGDEITSLESKVLLKGSHGNWHLVFKDSVVEAGDQIWPGKKFELACINCNTENYSITSYIDYMNIGNVLSTMQHFPIIENKIANILSDSKIGGILKNTLISTQWNEDMLDKVAYEASLDKFQISIPSQEIEISSLIAKAQGDHTQGSIEIDSNDLDLNMSKVLSHELKDQNVKGLISWVSSIDNIVSIEDLSWSSEGVDANLQGVIHFIDNQPIADIQALIPKSKLLSFKSYLPYKKMRPKLVKWLEEGVIGGELAEGKVVFRGNPKHFPFKSYPGVFEAIASIENGDLNYRLKWPHASHINGSFHIKNNNMKILGQKAKILNSSISNVVAEIDDLKLPRLVLTGESNGPASDILAYLQETPLLPEDSQIPKQISVSGDAGLDLEIIISLTKKIEKERSASGILKFKDTNLTVTSLSLPFTELSGQLKFSREGAEGKGLKAKLFGSEFTGSAKRLGVGRTQFDVMGDFNIDAYLAANYPNTSHLFNGTAPVEASIDIPRFGKHQEDKTLKIDISSNLSNTKINMPAPLTKQLDETKKLHIKGKYLKGTDNLFSVNYEDNVFIQAAVGEQINTNTQMDIRFGNSNFSLPDEGIKISGELGRIDLSEWAEIIKTEDKNGADTFTEVDIKANSIKAYGLEFMDVNFQLQKRNDNWVGDIDSSVAKGSFTYPIKNAADNIALGTFDYLRLKKSKDEIIQTIDPRSLPAMRLNTDQLKINEFEFNDVVLNTENSDIGMNIILLKGKGDDLSVDINGLWEGVDENTHNTRLDIQLVTQNLRNSITGLGFETSVNEGQGSITGNINWPATPYQFSLDLISGNANIRLKDGEISSVEPGAGRIIGLFNLGEISRRLSLDFTDFYSKGYVFDKIRGDLKFENSNLTTENLVINSSAADISIAGRTGFIAKDYDQIVTVTPHVSGGLPWLGLAVGGPLGAVGVIVGEKVAKTIGIDVNKVTEVKYSMTGSWDDPKIEPIAQTVADANSNTSALPATQGQFSPDHVKQMQSSESTTPLAN